MAYKTCWLIGSYAELPTSPIKVDGVSVNVPRGNYYLFDPYAGWNLLAALTLAALGAGVALSMSLRQTRRVKATAAGVFKIEWGSSTLLRDLLGFTGDLDGAAAYVAPSISPLLWSPARTESSMLAPLGIRGQSVAAVYQSTSPYDGTTENISHGAREYNRFIWRNVAINRVWTTGLLGGEFARWFAEVGVPGARWKLYREISESQVDTIVSIDDEGLGPYVVSADRRGVNWDYTRSPGLQWTDRQSEIELACHVEPEYPL